MKKVLIIVAVIATVGIVACNRHKRSQCCTKPEETTEVKEKVEDAAKAVGAAVKTKTEKAVDTLKINAEEAGQAASRKAKEVKKAAAEKVETAKEKIAAEKKKAGKAIVNTAEKVQDKLDE